MQHYTAVEFTNSTAWWKLYESPGLPLIATDATHSARPLRTLNTLRTRLLAGARGVGLVLSSADCTEYATLLESKRRPGRPRSITPERDRQIAEYFTARKAFWVESVKCPIKMALDDARKEFKLRSKQSIRDAIKRHEKAAGKEIANERHSRSKTECPINN